MLQPKKVTMAQRDSIRAANKARVDSTLNARAKKQGYPDVKSYMGDRGYDVRKKEKHVGVAKSDRPNDKKDEMGTAVGRAIRSCIPGGPACIYDDKIEKTSKRNGGRITSKNITMKKAANGDTIKSVKINRPETKQLAGIKGHYSKVKEAGGTKTTYNRTATKDNEEVGKAKFHKFEGTPTKPGDTIKSVRSSMASKKYGGKETHKYSVQKEGGVEKGKSTTYTAPSGKKSTISTTKFKKK